MHLGSAYDKQLATHPPSISLRIDFKINGARLNCVFVENGGRTRDVKVLPRRGEQWRGIKVRTIQLSGNTGGVDNNFRGETMAEEQGIRANR